MLQSIDWLWLLHPVLAVAVVYPLLGMVLRLGYQARDRRINQTKLPPTVGRDHADLGRWLAAAVVAIVLLALAVVILSGHPLAAFPGGLPRLALVLLVLLGTPTQHRAELLVLNLAAAVRVELVEELERLFTRHVEPERRHRLVKLLLRDEPVTILVPVAEEVDDAHGVVRERVANQLAHQPAARTIELDRRRERGAAPAARRLAQRVLLLRDQLRVLLEPPVKLAARDRAVPVLVELDEDRIYRCILQVAEAERAHGASELSKVHHAVPVLAATLAATTLTSAFTTTAKPTTFTSTAKPATFTSTA